MRHSSNIALACEATKKVPFFCPRMNECESGEMKRKTRKLIDIFPISLHRLPHISFRSFIALFLTVNTLVYNNSCCTMRRKKLCERKIGDNNFLKQNEEMIVEMD